MKKVDPGGCLPLSPHYIHVYDHHFQESSKTTWPIKAKFHVEPPWEGGKKVYINGTGHMTMQDGHHAHIWSKPSKIFSYITNSPMIMKLGMEHNVLKLYKVYINDDPELTLT